LINNAKIYCRIIVLVLQAKSKERSPEGEPLGIDGLIHPENDLRAALKGRRDDRKSLLKNLVILSAEISDKNANNLTWRQMFTEFSKCFNDCLTLISNEKLTFKHLSGPPRDLHTLQLPLLATRQKMPLNYFLQGFFAQPREDWHALLNNLQLSDVEKISATLAAININDNSEHTLAESLTLFLKMMTENKDYIYTMANRLLTMGYNNLKVPLQKLLDSEFYKDLSHRECNRAATVRERR